MAHSPSLDRLRRRFPLVDRFLGAQDGATAVEFAFVAIPFLLLIFAIIELGLVFLVSVTLDNAVIDAGRQVRTGTLQSSAGTAASFEAAVCARMNWLGSKCAGDLNVDVRTVSTFSASGSVTTPKTACWDPGGPGSIVLVRAYYNWSLMTPLLKTGLQTANGKQVITATTAFVNEPYSDIPAASVTCPA
jgi:Flp pilus assembly protein TadG